MILQARLCGLSHQCHRGKKGGQTARSEVQHRQVLKDGRIPSTLKQDVGMAVSPPKERNRTAGTCAVRARKKPGFSCATKKASTLQQRGRKGSLPACINQSSKRQQRKRLQQQEQLTHFSKVQPRDTYPSNAQRLCWSRWITHHRSLPRKLLRRGTAICSTKRFRSPR